MRYTIEYCTQENGSTMALDEFEAATSDEARETAQELLHEFNGADYALYWTGDEEAETVSR